MTDYEKELKALYETRSNLALELYNVETEIRKLNVKRLMEQYEIVGGVAIYTVTVESSHTTPIAKLVKRTRLPSEAEHVFNLWQTGLHNACGAFV